MFLPIYKVDAFTNKIFGGNPAAVCPLDKWLPTETMQLLAAENNLSETAFIVKEEKYFRIRWFTPTTEVALCGHATLAAAHIFFTEPGYSDDEIIFDSLSGLLKVRKGEQGKLTLDFPANMPTETNDVPEGLFEGLKINAALVFNAAWDYMVVLPAQKNIENLNPDFSSLAKIKARGVIVTAKGDDADFVSRCFYPQSGINEDPVTGSAHTVTGPYWGNILGKIKMKAIQLSARKGFLDIELSGNRVLMSGHAVTYLKGSYAICDGDKTVTG